MATINIKGDEINQEEFHKKTAEEVLSFAAEKFGGKTALASSFGAEDVVLIDMICRKSLKIGIFTLDTGRLPEETYKIIERIRDKYNAGIKSYFPKKEDVEKLEGEKASTPFIRA